MPILGASNPIPSAIPLTVAQLIDRGTRCSGRIVLAQRPEDLPNPQRDPVSRRRLARARRGNWKNELATRRLPGRYRSLPADQAWLEASLENFESCMYLAGVPDVDGTLRRLAAEAVNVVGGQGRYDSYYDQASCWRNSRCLWQRTGTAPLQSLSPRAQARMPGLIDGSNGRLLFDPAGSKTDIWHNRGLQTHGPFDAESF